LGLVLRADGVPPGALAGLGLNGGAPVRLANLVARWEVEAVGSGSFGKIVSS